MIGDKKHREFTKACRPRREIVSMNHEIGVLNVEFGSKMVRRNSARFWTKNWLFLKERSFQKLTRLFDDKDVHGMLRASDFDFIDNVSLFLW